MVRGYANEQGPSVATYEIDWSNPGDLVIVDFVMHQYRAGKDRRRAWEYEAAQRLAWVRGNQHLFWDKNAGHDHEQDLRAWGGMSEQEKALHERFPMQVNMLKRFIMSWIGLVIAKPVGWHVFPGTTDSDDIGAAQLATELLEYYWSSGIAHGMTRLLDAMWHMYATGIIWVKPIWDPQKHFSEHFSDATDQKDLPTGDLVYDFVTGFELTEPEGCRNVYEAGWIIESRLRSIEWGMERYGEKFKDVNPNSRAQNNNLHTYEMSGLEQGDAPREGTAPDDRVLVHEIWRPKSATVEEGYFAVIADNQFIHGGQHPYVHGRLPYVALQEQPDFEHFRPGCSTRDMMDLQHARNKNRSQRQAHLDRSIRPIILKEQGVQLPEGAFEIDGPTIVEVGGRGDAVLTGRVQAFDLPKLPTDIYQLDEINRRDMEDIGGVHPNTMGRTESSSQSGKHAAMMTQGDVRTNSVTRMIAEKAMGKVGQQGLWLLWQFVETDRMLPITGPNKVAQVRKFKGEDLTSSEHRPFGPYEFNVQVKIGVESDMQAVMARIDVLTERGWLRPERETDRQMVLKWLGEEVVQGNDPREAHRANARGENEKMLQSPDLVPSAGDDDAVHVFEHQLFRTTAEFKGRQAKEPTTDASFEKHIKMHWELGARKMLEPQIIAADVRIDLLRDYPQVAEAMKQQQQMQQAGRSSSGGNNVAAKRQPAQAGTR